MHPDSSCGADDPQFVHGPIDRTRIEAKLDVLLGAIESPGGTPNEEPPPGLVDYFRVLRRHAVVMLVLAVGLGAAGWYLASKEQKVYRARTTLELLEPGRMLNIRSLSSSNPIFGGDTYMQTQVSKLRSVTLVKAAWDRLHPGNTAAAAADDQTIRRILGNLDAGPVRGTSMIEVNYEAPDPKAAAQFANTLTQEYIENDMESRSGNAEQTRAWLNRELRDTQARLEDSERRLQQYAHSSGLLYTSPNGNAAEEADQKLQFIANELSDVQAKRATLEARYDIASAQTSGLPVSESENSALHGIQSRLVDLQRQRASLASQFTPSYHELKKVDAEIAELKTAEKQAYQNWIRQRKEDYETEAQHEKLVQAEYQKQQVLVSDQASKAIHYNVLKREVETNRNLYDSLLGGMKEAEVNAAARVRNARVVDAATPPLRPYRPNPARNAAIGVLAGLMLGMVAAVLRESGDKRVNAPGAVATCLNLPELGVIPSIPARLLAHSRILLWNGSGRLPSAAPLPKERPVADAFHAAVVSIFFSKRLPEPPRVVVITSGVAHEGKSTVAENLALMASRMGKRVLLVDGDFRYPRLHKTYALSNERGLANLLVKSDRLVKTDGPAVVQETKIERLSVLPSGPVAGNLLPLLHSERLGEAIEQWREDFDLVLIDTPPVLEFADARVFGKLADAAVLVVRARRTTRSMVMAAKARFREDGLPVIGTILNDWSGKVSGYEYTEQSYRA